MLSGMPDSFSIEAASPDMNMPIDDQPKLGAIATLKLTARDGILRLSLPALSPPSPLDGADGEAFHEILLHERINEDNGTDADDRHGHAHGFSRDLGQLLTSYGRVHHA